MDKLTDYFAHYNPEQEIETNQEMAYLLKILPSTLKSQLAKFLYQEAIMVNRLLQDRDDSFYVKYLEELKSDRFNRGDIIARKGDQAECVFFIMSGVVKNLSSGRFFESGSMINHDSLLEKKLIQANMVAETDVNVLKYEALTFQQILDQFPDFYEDLKKIIKDRQIQEENQKFQKMAINDLNVRQAIVNYYHDLILEAQKKEIKQQQTQALRISKVEINSREFFNVKTKKVPKPVAEPINENQEEEKESTVLSQSFQESSQTGQN